MFACRTPQHRSRWRVRVRRANYSAFNGGRRTPSAYSELVCLDCGARWRTKAAYVDGTSDLTAAEDAELRSTQGSRQPRWTPGG